MHHQGSAWVCMDDSFTIKAGTYQFVSPLDLLFHILDGESPNVVTV